MSGESVALFVLFFKRRLLLSAQQCLSFDLFPIKSEDYCLATKHPEKRHICRKDASFITPHIWVIGIPLYTFTHHGTGCLGSQTRRKGQRQVLVPPDLKRQGFSGVCAIQGFCFHFNTSQTSLGDLTMLQID